ncbi:MAG: transcription-repair coupling factor, partial [Pseudomonadota bacterium]
MKIFSKIQQNEKLDLFPLPTDSYGLILSQIIGSSIFITSDDQKLEVLAQQIKFFNPNKKLLIFPSWDCSPYDKVSPNIHNLIQRINTLDALTRHVEALDETSRESHAGSFAKAQDDGSTQDDKDIILLTSIDALIQRLLPADLLKDLVKKIKVGDKINREAFLSQLIELSYRRCEVASEPGEFAVRGDIIDIVIDFNNGWRLDFFGNELEQLRSYDLTSQISNGKINEITILPSSEVVLNHYSIKNFCKNFLSNFIHQENHPLYEAISSGRKYPGMEHYLPFFYDNLSDIFDYFSPNNIIYEHNFIHQLDEYIYQINENYEARKNLLNNHFQDEVIFHPITPSNLWMTKAELIRKLDKHRKIILHNFKVDFEHGIDLEMKKMDDFNILAQSKKISAFDLFKQYREKSKIKLFIACNSEGSLQRIKTLLENYNIHWYRINKFNEYINISGKTVGLAMLPIEHGFSFDNFAIVSEQDLLGEKIARKKSDKNLANLLGEINNIQIGEYVVHKQHGIALFSGLETIKAVGVDKDCIKLTYSGGDILYIPVENLDLLTRFGSSEEEVHLDKLGGVAWQNRKKKLKEKLFEIAASLINTAATRTNSKGESLVPVYEAYEEFSRRFSYVETEDQMNSIRDVESDLASGVPMDRLICGDVGFGKTEVAMRAAFIATNPEHNIKQQVAIIVPTTLLARQHYHSFLKRFAGFPMQIRQLSRLVNAKETKLIKEGIKEGLVDIVIGTHSLLGKEIEFKNLGLLIIDEEHRFGVIQKERLKTLQKNVHILNLSATPIPRTLQMSLTGVRDLSIIATPPIDRQVVKTYIMNFDSIIIREAILREYHRGGQVFFVCPRISDINELLPKLVELLPEIKIIVAHGQMSPNSLEEIMSDFYNKKYNLLLSTSIIESGIDIPEANTIIIYRADKFGLAALYQLRGRVGRSNIKAYSYLLLPNHKLSKLSKARLEVMHTIDSLGAGFTVASHDMDIRGFGNLVGDEQSGHIKEVGLELYQEMLQEAIFSLKNPDKTEEIEDDYSPQVNIGIPAILPED